MLNRLFFLLLLLAPPLAASADKLDHARELRDAQAALDAGDLATAYQRYLNAADGNPLAQFTLGMFHQHGWGRPVDKDAACGWFERAAQRKVPAGMHHAAECLLRQPGAEGNAGKAYDLFMGAARAGHFVSLCDAGELLIRGKGVAKDVQQGLALCTQAAQGNSPPAMHRLGDYYRSDADVPRDLAAARNWYQGAAERDHPDAKYKLAIMLAQGEGGAPDVPRALRLMEEAAAAGHVPAYLPTALLYANMPPHADTGAPAPEQLAKVYLWSAAAKARLADPALRANAAKLNDEASAMMPPTWRPELDRKVAAHLAKYNPKQ